MSAEDMLFIQNELNKSRDELLELIVVLRKQLLEYQSYMTENSSAITAMSRDYQKLLTEVKDLRQENKDLREVLAHTVEKEQLKTKELFGRGTEKLSDIYGSAPDIEEIDEAETEIIEFPYSDESITVSVKLPDIRGNCDIEFRFLPGCDFDFDSFEILKHPDET